MTAGKLTEVKVGQQAKIIKLLAEGTLRKRFLDMGIVPGAQIKVERVAPFGDPVEIMIRGYALSLRKEEAALVAVEI